jgi:hypothetical protein
MYIRSQRVFSYEKWQICPFSIRSPEGDRKILNPQRNHNNRWRFSDFLYRFWMEAAHSHIDNMGDLYCMKKIGFLSFGHWTPSPQSQTQSATDALLQSIDLAVEAERLGMDGAYFRVHHFAQQLASPFPLLAAVGAKTRKIEIGTAVIDMRYENPHYMAEDAGAADLISGGRLQLGISRGSPEQVIDGWRYFGYRPIEGQDDAGIRDLHPFTMP